MALRDQPYLPLFVQDVLTDEKLIECSAESTGVYFRLLCILHKPKEYGKILLKQKDKQDVKQVRNFALKLLKQMPYSLEVIERSLEELLSEDVIQVEGDYLSQKRMVRDNEISLKRAEAGKKGGEKTQLASRFAKAKKKAKHKANTEYENEYEYENENNKTKIDTAREILEYLNEKTGRNFSDASFILARLNEGKAKKQCIQIIDNQLQDPYFQENPKYLNPETLFRPKNFDKYLNNISNPMQGRISIAAQRTIKNIQDMELS